jgi:hypothetical protein
VTSRIVEDIMSICDWVSVGKTESEDESELECLDACKNVVFLFCRRLRVAGRYERKCFVCISVSID